MYEIWQDGMFVMYVAESELPALRGKLVCFVDSVSRMVIVF